MKVYKGQKVARWYKFKHRACVYGVADWHGHMSPCVVSTLTDRPSMCTQRPAAVNIDTLMLAAVSPAPPPDCELRLLINVLHRHRYRCLKIETRERVTYRCEDDDDRVSLSVQWNRLHGRGRDPWNRLQRKCPPESNVSPVDRLWWPRLLLLHLTALATSCWRRISRHGVSMDSYIIVGYIGLHGVSVD